MAEISLLSVIVEGIPNFVGFGLLAWIMNRTMGRMLDLVEKCIDQQDESE